MMEDYQQLALGFEDVEDESIVEERAKLLRQRKHKGKPIPPNWGLPCFECTDIVNKLQKAREISDLNYQAANQGLAVLRMRFVSAQTPRRRWNISRRMTRLMGIVLSLLDIYQEADYAFRVAYIRETCCLSEAR